MRRGHIGITAAVALVVSACLGGGSTHAKPPDIPTLIRPSASIGPVRIGEPRAKVEALLGIGHAEALGQEASFLSANIRYPQAGLEVGYSKDTRPIVLRVVTQSPRYRTRSGIGIGSLIERLDGVVPVTCRGRFTVRSCDVGTGPHSGPAMRFHALDGQIDTISLIAVITTDGHLSPPDPGLAATG